MAPPSQGAGLSPEPVRPGTPQPASKRTVSPGRRRCHETV